MNRKIAFLAVLGCSVLWAGSTSADTLYVQTVLTDNPIACWQMDEAGGTTLVDRTNNYHGTYLNNPTIQEQGAALGTGKSVRFNGHDQYADASINLGQSFSVEMWVKSAHAIWQENGWFASARVANGFIMHPDVFSTGWRGFVFDNNGQFHSIGGIDVGDDDIETFHHYAMTYDYATDTGKMFLDGQLLVTNEQVLDGATRNVDTTITVWLARDSGEFGHRYGDGWIDDVSIYDYALSDAQVQSQYDAAVITVTADQMTVFRGFQIGGSLEDTFESDDSRISFNPGFTLSSAEAPVWLIFDGTIPSETNVALNMILESQAGTPGLTGTLEAWNWQTEDYDVVDETDASFNNDTLLRIDLSTNIGDYVQSGTGGGPSTNRLEENWNYVEFSLGSQSGSICLGSELIDRYLTEFNSVTLV